MSTSARRPDQQPSDRFTLAHILSDHSQSIALVIAPDGIILDLNARMALVLGRPLKQLKGTYLQAYLPPETYAAFQVSFCETVNSRQPSRHDLECGGRWYDCRLTPCVDEQDQVVAVSAVGWDITERKEAERRNADLTALLEGTLECTADGILVTDGCGEMLLSNRRFAEMWRLPEAILASGDDRAALQFAQAQLERPEEFFAEVNNLYANPEVTAFSRLRFKDGRVFERYSHSRSLTNGVIGRVWSFRDVTAKARAEASLRQQAEEVHDLYNHAPCGYHSLDRDGVVVRMNDTELAWLGYSREEVIGKLKITDLLTVSGSVVFAQLFPHFQATGSVSEIELELVRKDGSLLPVSISATAVTDAEGRFVMSRSTIHDIRGRRRKEEELRRTVASLAEAQEIAHLGSFVYDVTQNLVVHSPQLDRILGLGPDTERTPDAWSRLVHPDDRTAVAAVLKACLESGVPFDVDYRVNRASDGETRWLRGTGRAERDVSGKVIRISGVNLDITERKEAEMALARSAHSSERLRGALMALNRCADLDSALSCLLREAIGLTGLDGGGVYVLEGGEALLRHQIGLPAEFVSKVARRALDTPHVKAVFEHPGEVLDLTSQFPNPREWGEPHGLRHVYSTALATEQGPLAMLTLASLQPEPTSAYSLELIRILTLEMESVFRRLAVADRLQRVGWQQRILLDGSLAGIAHVKERKVQWANLSHDLMLGFKAGITVGMDTAAFYAYPADYERVGRESLEQFAQGKHYSLEVEMRRKDGSTFWCGIAGRAVDATRPAEGSIWNLRDVTRRRRAEQALQESEANFRAFFEAIGDLILVATPGGRLLFANQAVERKLGYSAEALARMHVLDLHPAEVRRDAEEIFAAMFRGERAICPLPLACQNGELLPVETRVWFGRWSGQDCIFGFCKDLSVEQEAQQRFERLFRHNPAPMALTALPDQRFCDVNDSFLKTLGYAKNEILGKSALELELFVRPEARDVAAQQLQASGRIADHELQVRCKDGRVLDGLFSGETITSQGRQYFLTVMLDITERKRMERALAASEQTLRRLGDSLPSGMIYQLMGGNDGRRRFTYVSAGVEPLHGIKPEQVLQDPSLLYDQILPEDRPLVASKELESLRTLVPFSAEVRSRNTLGEVRWILLRSAPTPLSDGRVRWDGLELDITERKQLEERLRQSQKMESIGHLAGGVAHQFNNILAGVIMMVDLVPTIPAEEGADLLRQIREECQRAAELVRQLLAVGQRAMISPKPLDLADLIVELRPALHGLLGEDIDLRISAQGAFPLVSVDAATFERILLDLCQNAREAMKPGGQLTLRLDTVNVGTKQAEGRRTGQPGLHVRLAVTDTGCGMSEATLKRLFEPFFTTKDVGQGTGLGLAAVLGIIEQHHGWVEVMSREGEGTTFWIYLPALEAAPRPAPTRPREELARGTGTILLVEDAPVLRRASSRFLTRAGYSVLEAGDDREAIALWEEHRTEIDLLYTDVVLGGAMNGQQLAERLQQDKPSLKVILTSGYNEAVVDETRRSETGMIYLPKPCPLDTLTAVISRCLQGK